MAATPETVYGNISTAGEKDEERIESLRSSAMTSAGVTVLSLLVLLLMALHLNSSPTRGSQLAVRREIEMRLLAVPSSHEAIRMALDDTPLQIHMGDRLQSVAQAESLRQRQQALRRAARHVATKQSQDLKKAVSKSNGMHAVFHGGSLAGDIDDALSDKVEDVPQRELKMHAAVNGCSSTGICEVGLDRLDDRIVSDGQRMQAPGTVESPRHLQQTQKEGLASSTGPRPIQAHLQFDGRSLAGEVQNALSDDIARVHRASIPACKPEESSLRDRYDGRRPRPGHECSIASVALFGEDALGRLWD